MRAHPAVWLILAAALAWIALRRFERMMVFVPSRTMTSHPGTVGLAWEPVALTASDGTRLSAWWIPGPAADAPVMLCLHGNGGNLSTRVDKMRLFRDAGAAQLWVDWRGYGDSKGSPDEPGLYRDGLAAWAWLGAAKAVPPERLVLYGESLGCAVAVELATRVPAGALVLDSGFTSIPDMAALVLPFFPRRLVKTRFDNRSKLEKVATPLTVLHSPQDEIIPFSMARDNLAAHPGPKRLVELRGGHNDGFLETGAAYPAAIREILAGLPPVEAAP
jgi:uncharacterized protein